MASTDIDFQPAQPKKNGLAAKWNGFRTFCYNPDGGTFCGRTCSSWFKITAFYLVYYSILAGFSVAMMAIFFTTLDNDQPKQQGMQSLIKGNPGLAFRPMPNTESTLIKFNSGDEPSFKKYKEAIDTFLDAYDSDTVDKEGETIPCPAGYVRPEGETRPCKFDIAQLGNWCTKTNNYGFFEGQPCVILKLNKVYDWIADVYTSADAPQEFTSKATSRMEILTIIAPADRAHTSTFGSSTIGVTCETAEKKDQGHLLGYKIWPESGFQANYLPYLNKPAYRSPLVAVAFETTRNQEVRIWCRAWAHNLENDHMRDRNGGVWFDVEIHP